MVALVPVTVASAPVPVVCRRVMVALGLVPVACRRVMVALGLVPVVCLLKGCRGIYCHHPEACLA